MSEPGEPERRGVVILPAGADREALVGYDPDGRAPGDPPRGWHDISVLTLIPEQPADE